MGKYKFKDSQPEVGIFELIGNKFCSMGRMPQYNQATLVMGKLVDDAGEYFHADLVKQALESLNIEEDIKAKCRFISQFNRYQIHTLFPRGRVTAEWEGNSRVPQFVVYIPSEFKNGQYLERIIRNFSLPQANTTFVIDNSAYHTADLDSVYESYKSKYGLK